MRQSDILSRPGGNISNRLNVVYLIVCCSPLSRTPSNPHPLITYHTSRTTHHNRYKSDKALFLVMDFIDGKPLTNLLGEQFFSSQLQAQTNFPHAADMAFQVIRTLLRLHSMDLIHCDIKPENVMRSLSTGHKPAERTSAERSRESVPSSSSVSVKNIKNTNTDTEMVSAGTFLSRADVVRMRHTWLSSPAQGGDIP